MSKIQTYGIYMDSTNISAKNETVNVTVNATVKRDPELSKGWGQLVTPLMIRGTGV